MALTEEQLGDRLIEVAKYLRTLRSAEHLDLAIASMTEVFPRYWATTQPTKYLFLGFM